VEENIIWLLFGGFWVLVFWIFWGFIFGFGLVLVRCFVGGGFVGCVVEVVGGFCGGVFWFGDWLSRVLSPLGPYPRTQRKRNTGLASTHDSASLPPGAWRRL